MEPAPNSDQEIVTDADGHVLSATTRSFSQEEVSEPGEVVDFGPTPAPRKVDPDLEGLLATLGDNEAVTIIVGVQPPEPTPALSEVLRGESLLTEEGQRRRTNALESWSRRRLASQRPFQAPVLAARGKVSGSFPFCNCFTSTMPARVARQLAADPGIRRLDLQTGNEVGIRGTDPVAFNELAFGKEMIGAFPYEDAGYDGSPLVIALIDTGVEPRHEAFGGLQAPFVVLADCVHSVHGAAAFRAYCQPDPRLIEEYDPVDHFRLPDGTLIGHGTSVAAVLGARLAPLPWYNGVSRAEIDSYKVNELGAIPADDGITDDALLAGMNAFASNYGSAVNISLGSARDERSAASVAADELYDWGSAVFAANGNFGPDEGTVDSPANAHKALGIGAFDITSGDTYEFQARGPTLDGRVKPEIQAPHNVETASLNVLDDPLEPDELPCLDCVAVFPGTSAAAPFVTAATTLLQHLGMDVRGLSAGATYASLIAFGTDASLSSERGFGPLRLRSPRSGRFLWAHRLVVNGETTAIDFETREGDQNLSIGIWWPEGLDEHSNLVMTLLDPTGAEIESRPAGDQVLFREELPTTLEPFGIWRVFLRFNVFGNQGPPHDQEVFVLVHHARAG